MPNLSKRITIKKVVLKRINPNRAPIDYQLLRKRAKDEDKFTVLMREDPILLRKGNEQVRKGLENHELNEVNARLHGMSKNQAHRYAVSKEGQATKQIRGHKKFWNTMNDKYNLGLVYVPKKK